MLPGLAGKHTTIYKATKSGPSLFLALVSGRGHRGRVKVTSGAPAAGQGFREGGRWGCIKKRDATQVALYPPRPAQCKRKPRSVSTQFTFCTPLSTPAFSSTRRLHAAQDEDGSIICTENAGSLQNVDFCSARRGSAASW